MPATPDHAELVNRLVALRTTEPVPREEWEWLVAHGTLESYEAGFVVASPGVRIELLWIVLSGHVAVSVDRGTGLRQVAEWRTGEVTGRLPYSRHRRRRQLGWSGRHVFFT